MRILVVEDEESLRTQLESSLTKEGFVVDVARDGEEGLYFGNEYPIDIAIIDLGLPKISGMEVITKLRTNKKQFPILILTANGRWQDKVEGLSAGADDYLVKPFQMEELLARINALIRRSNGWSQASLECGPIRLNLASKKVLLNNLEVELTAYEFKVLEYLMLHTGAVVSKSELTEHIYSDDDDRDSNVIEVFIRRLRKKLDPDDKLKPIETLRGVGYRLAVGSANLRA